MCLLAGYRLHIPYHYYQFLDPALLRSRLAESIFYLHAQPPIMNLVLGLALKIADAMGTKVETLLFILHAVLGALAVVGLTLLNNRLLRRRALRWVCLAIVIFHPVFYMMIFEYFYTLHEVVFLAVIAPAVGCFAQSRSLRSYTLAAASIIGLVYTRSLFHPLWAIGALGGLLFAPTGGAGSLVLRSKPTVIFVLAVALILAWPVKSALQFGVFGFSSWRGFNLSQGLGIDPGIDPEIGVKIPEKYKDIPVLTQKVKLDRWKNHNNFAKISSAKLYQRMAIQKMIEEPLLVVKKAALNYWKCTRFSGRHPYSANMGTIYHPIPSTVSTWMRLYEIVLYQDFRSPMNLLHPTYRYSHMRPWHISGFFLVLPIVLFASARGVVRGWRTDPARATLAAFMLYTIVWVLLMVLFVDGNEGNRMRFSTEPYLLILAFWSWPWLWSEKSAVRMGRDHPAQPSSP